MSWKKKERKINEWRKEGRKQAGKQEQAREDDS